MRFKFSLFPLFAILYSVSTTNTNTAAINYNDATMCIYANCTSVISSQQNPCIERCFTDNGIPEAYTTLAKCTNECQKNSSVEIYNNCISGCYQLVANLVATGKIKSSNTTSFKYTSIGITLQLLITMAALSDIV
ncbi:hypothetical protein BB559_003197 [Furculomyces boomerangus]|uniref:Transmembrane protein n=2 Tax=Harpellales TaxID=61421 RepID=A0A2T9YMX5_9FUNG|nr:hypothetical protein BB559_003197 [Furculomyces boomerangus]PVZ99033.1 hypothetical protein BB558_004959 [Smittium angustum]